ncbi:hypothetical protein [Mesomycoplasma hyorhinis]|uniref:hypothetical protein n=1 Tax=Mesomycoplasma hyorhinis TaxID=2100 RepID=UPI001C047CB8|nr:hypothetical protein [Mesomycoplasma hyorhinis]
MSQTTFLTLNEPEIKKCDSLLREIENLKEVNAFDKNFQENLENYYNELKELRNTFQKGEGIRNYIRLNWLKQLHSLSKRISNLDWNKEINAYLDRVSKNAKVNVFQFYTQYGIVDYEAIEYLETTNSALTNELIESTITEFLKREVDQEKLNSFRKQRFEWIDKNIENESSEIRYELKNFIKQYNNFEDISDLVYLINTRKEEIQKINS